MAPLMAMARSSFRPKRTVPGVPVVPVAIKGVYEMWPRNRGINWKLLTPWSGHRVRIAIGEPIMLDEAADYNESAQRLHDRVDELWQRI